MIQEAPLPHRLVALAEEAGIHLTARQIFLCLEHVRLMLHWNRRLNLTRITRPDQVIIRHILDSLIPSRWLPQEGHALDVGTGPGFPGIPLKIVNPGLKMTLLDAQRKKVSFLRVVLSELALENICAEQGRWEEMVKADQGNDPPGFKLITTRALRLQWDEIARLGSLLAGDGMLAWWVGPGERSGESGGLTPETSGQEVVRFAAEHTYTLPTFSEERRILIWKRRV